MNPFSTLSHKFRFLFFLHKYVTSRKYFHSLNLLIICLFLFESRSLYSLYWAENEKTRWSSLSFYLILIILYIFKDSIWVKWFVWAENGKTRLSSRKIFYPPPALLDFASSGSGRAEDSSIFARILTINGHTFTSRRARRSI